MQNTINLMLAVGKPHCYEGMCPFHVDQHSRSFCFNSLTKEYSCEECGRKGKMEDLPSDLAKFVKPQ